MPSRKRKKDDLRALCAHVHPDDGVDPHEDKRRDAEHVNKPNRKTWQLCKQVTQTLQLALGSLPCSDVLVGVSVQSVTPAPDAGRLCVVIAVPEPQRQEEVATAVRRHRGRLRGEVAAAITRRRTPELTFEFAVEGVSRD